MIEFKFKQQDTYHTYYTCTVYTICNKVQVVTCGSQVVLSIYIGNAEHYDSNNK